MINKNILKEQQLNKIKVLKNKNDKNIKNNIFKMFNSDMEEMKSIIKNELFFENIYQDELEFHMNKIKNIENIADKFYVLNFIHMKFQFILIDIFKKQLIFNNAFHFLHITIKHFKYIVFYIFIILIF
ncbi:hypothetical protein [Clostridioides difficile]|uniref:hypothetical protein n=4 Tax=Clostridioides difficile TaxID=1496 RepID=UPI002A912633|nr:hypothetical protein [Clostridioides difficile]MDY6541604.1 hypothetical protein [Clostridioides difficile]